MLDLLSLPDSITTGNAVLLAVATMLTSFISGVMGIGGGVMLLGVMAVLLPAAVLIPLHGVVQFASNGFRSLLLVSHIQKSVLLPFVLGSAVGSVFSGSLVIQLPAWAIQFGIAGFIILAVLGKVNVGGAGSAAVAGVISGFLTMLFGATGPFVGGFVRNLNLPRLQHVSTMASMMALQHAIKLSVFGVLGFAFGRYIGLLGLLIGCSMAGTAVGRVVLLSVNEKLFRKLLNLILIILAVRLIWQGTQSLIG